MREFAYRSLSMCSNGWLIDSGCSVGWIVSRDGRYVAINSFGEPYQFGNVGNCFLTPEEAVEALFAWLHPEFIEGDG